MKWVSVFVASALMWVASGGALAASPRLDKMPTADELNAAVEALVLEAETTLRRDARGRITSVRLFGTPTEVRYVGEHVEAIRVGNAWLAVREDRMGNEATGRLVYLSPSGELLGSERLKADEMAAPDMPRFLPLTDAERQRAAELRAEDKLKWEFRRPKEYDQVCVWRCDTGFESRVDVCDRDADFQRLFCDALPATVRYICAAHAIEERNHCRARARAWRDSCRLECGL